MQNSYRMFSSNNICQIKSAETYNFYIQSTVRFVHAYSALRTIRTSDYSYPGLFDVFVLWVDYSYLGRFVRWTFRTTDYSYYGQFVPSVKYFTTLTVGAKEFLQALTLQAVYQMQVDLGASKTSYLYVHLWHISYFFSYNG